MDDFLKQIPAQAIYTIIAMGGGIARYLNNYASGAKFSVTIFLASAIVAGFSGYMFALFGDSLNLPYPMSHILAGLGGFFGDQSLKFMYEYFTKKQLKK